MFVRVETERHIFFLFPSSIDYILSKSICKSLMQLSMGNLNLPSSSVVKDSMPCRRQILRYIDFSIGESSPILIFGHESSPNNIWGMVNLERTCILLFYYFLYFKVNLPRKNKPAWWIFTQFYFWDCESWPNYFGKEVNWWWILTWRFRWNGEQRWRLEVGRFKMPFDACISTKA